MRRLGSGSACVALLFAIACGPSPDAQAPAPTGTLVIVIRQGAERVPFQPKVDRIRRANEQLGAILGHSIQVELDGSLLPQDHDGAQDVMARLLETVAQDLDSLKRYEPKAMSFAATKFERLVVRYSPAEAGERGRHHSVLQSADKTLDVVLDESRWLALQKGDISGPLIGAFHGEQTNKYAHVLPNEISPGERKAWMEYQLHKSSRDEPGQKLGSVDILQVRGLVQLAGDGDVEARKYLLQSVFGDFSGTYHHHQADVENAPAGGPFKKAETEYVAWLNGALPSMTVEERAVIARSLWVYDFRKNGERDPWAPWAFPGLDKMAFGFAQADAWVAANHPSRVPVYDDVVAPVRLENAHGEFSFHGEGKHNPDFYRWALAAAPREDAFVKGLLQRKDPQLVSAAFYNAHTALRDENDYLRFLRRFETSPAHWRTGADVHRAVIYRPSTAVLEEARRHWRELPIARATALLYFARQADGSYHPEVEWPDMLQDRKVDDTVLKEEMALGWPGYELLPVYWRQIAHSNNRLTIVEDAALELLKQDIHVPPGHRDIGGILAQIGRLDCEDDDKAEVAALRKWAESQIPSHPGQGLSQIIEETGPNDCKPKKRPAAVVPAVKRPIGPSAPPKRKWKEGDPLPPKTPDLGW